MYLANHNDSGESKLIAMYGRSDSKRAETQQNVQRRDITQVINYFLLFGTFFFK